MKKFLIYLLSIFSLFVFFTYLVYAQSINLKLRGKILLQVEDKGQAWYVNPQNNNRYYMGKPKDAFNLMRSLGIGISNENLYKIPIGIIIEGEADNDQDGLPNYLENVIGLNANNNDTDGDGYNDAQELNSINSPWGTGKQPIDLNFAKRHIGKIFLQIENKGEAWYINPSDEKRYYLGRPRDAFNVMKKIGLGISNNNLEKIDIGNINSLEEHIEQGSNNLNSIQYSDGVLINENVQRNYAKEQQLAIEREEYIQEKKEKYAELLSNNVSTATTSNLAYLNAGVTIDPEIMERIEYTSGPIKLYTYDITNPKTNYDIEFENFCITEEEARLIKIINDYRVTKGLSRIPASKSLSYIEKIHIFDLIQHPTTGSCSPHSWSDGGNWTDCCAIVGNAPSYWCLDEKPEELTTYPADAETAENMAGMMDYQRFWIPITPEECLSGWQNSYLHHIVIINESWWKNYEWKALGVAIYNGIAYMLVGDESDPAGEPALCSNNNYSNCDNLKNENLKNECLEEKN